MTNRWNKRRSARERWSLNAVRAKARNREEAPDRPVEEKGRKIPIPRAPRAAWVINLTRHDGERLQLKIHDSPFGEDKKLFNRSVTTYGQIGRFLGWLLEAADYRMDIPIPDCPLLKHWD